MFLEIRGGSLKALELGQIYLLGKQINDDKKLSENFIELDDTTNISEKHCVIETNQKEAYVFDLFSVEGTILNNQRVSCVKKTLLKDGDILKIGDKEIKFINQGHELSCDSSGFLEVQKSISYVTASTPEPTSQVPKCLKGSDQQFQFQKPTTSFSNRQSDSFAIPETQYCQPRNSLSNSRLSIAESDKTDGKIKFNFGNQDSFGDDDFCIPETQELMPVGLISSNQKPCLTPEGVQHKAKQPSLLNEENANLSGGSQFRICTQDYNEGFGEEETVDGLHSQIIPIIKHSPYMLNKTDGFSKTNSLNQSALSEQDKELCSLKFSNSNTDQETTKLRGDCVTPNIFEFEATDNKEASECAADERPNKQNLHILDTEEDEEDLLPTQCLPSVFKKVEKQNIFKDSEKPCLEKENDDVLTSSDKENICPVVSRPIVDLQPTQIFEARSHTSIPDCNSIESAIKVNEAQRNDNSPISSLNIDPDEEDDLLTQAFLQPTSTSSSSNKNLHTKLFNSTLSTNKGTEKITAAERPQFKEMPTSSAKIPDKDLGILRKTCSTASSTSENDIDMLLCTPQLIRDNISLGKSEDLKKDILAAKSRHLFGDDSEDEDDEQNNLVKFINVPKDSLDFDLLLVHLNQDPESGTEKRNEGKEAQKLHRFNISFGKEQDEKQANSSTTKSSAYSRDERHAARDKERENSERNRKARTIEGNNKASSKRLERKVEAKDKEKKNAKEVGEKKERKSKKSELEQNLKNSKTEEIQRNHQNIQNPAISKEDDDDNKSENSRRLRKQTSVKNEKQKISPTDNEQTTPPKRLTRSNSRMKESSSLSNAESKDDIDSISTEPYLKRTRSRLKSRQTDSQDSAVSTTSNKTNEVQQSQSSNTNVVTKKSKRRAESPTAAAVVPAKVERKRLRSMHSQESLATPESSIAVSVTNVDYELLKDLMKNAKGLWHITSNAADSEILVMDKPLRTFKFLLAMARGIPIVTSDYLKQLNKSKSAKQMNIKDYHFADNEFEKKYEFSLLRSLHVAKKQQIFKNYEFLMTGGILPIPQEIKALIETSGGCVHNKTPPHPKNNQKLYLVTTKADKKDWHKYRRLNKNIIIVSTEAIMSAIMSQSVERMNSFILA